MSHTSPPPPQVWEAEHLAEIAAPPAAIWSFLSDVSTWPRWKAGVLRIDLEGAFAANSRFVMTLPDGTAVHSRLVEVNAERNFLDETRLGEVTVFVDHRLESVGDNRTRVVYAIEVFGPTCDDVGPAICADFPDVLARLAAHAEALARAEG